MEHQHGSNKERLLGRITQSNVLGFTCGTLHILLRRTLPPMNLSPNITATPDMDLQSLDAARVISIRVHTKLQARTINKTQIYLFRKVYVRGDLREDAFQCRRVGLWL